MGEKPVLKIPFYLILLVEIPAFFFLHTKISFAGAGNKCGHKPSVPEFFKPPEHDKERPWHIKNLIERIPKAYTLRKRYLVHLYLTNPKFSQKRTERMEAICKILQVMVYFTDFKTYRVGKPNREGQFKDFSIALLAKHAGLNLRRAKSAISDLIAAGYLECKQQYYRTYDGNGNIIKRAVASIKKFTLKFFYHMQVNHKTLLKIANYHKRKEAEAKTRDSFYRTEAEHCRNKIIEVRGASKNFTENIPQHVVDIFKKTFRFSKK